MFQVILNPYGIAYTLGLMPAGAAAPNPRPGTLEDYLSLSEEFGLAGAELFTPMLDAMSVAGLATLKKRLGGKTVVMSQPLWTGIGRSIEVARALGTALIRMHLTPVLCGDRACCKWEETVREVRRMLREASEQAGEYGISLAIENHQDFTSDELMELCETTGANVGVCLDTGNALSVGEDPVSFARTIAPRVKHVHFKDYQVHWSDEGYRLVRCAIGDGVIPFSEIATVLRRDAPLTVGVEIGALAARHIRVLTPQWWNGYPSRPHDSVWAALAAARVRMMDEHEDWRTPWEKGEIPEAIVAYEMDQLRRSVTYVKGMAL